MINHLLKKFKGKVAAFRVFADLLLLTLNFEWPVPTKTFFYAALKHSCWRTDCVRQQTPHFLFLLSLNPTSPCLNILAEKTCLVASFLFRGQPAVFDLLLIIILHKTHTNACTSTHTHTWARTHAPTPTPTPIHTHTHTHTHKTHAPARQQTLC